MARILSERDKQVKKEWAIRNAELTKQRNKARYEQKKEAILQRCREYVEENRMIISERRKRKYQEQREELLRRKREHYRLNKAEYAERARIAYEGRKEACLEANRRNRQKQKELIAALPDEERRIFLKQRRERERTYREENWGRILEHKKKYAKKNPHKTLEKDARRRRRLSAAVTTEEREEVRVLLLQWKRKVSHYCTYCDVEIRGSECCVDHIFPVALGGRHVAVNLCLACRSCNSRKGAKILGETWTPAKDR